MTTTMMMTMTMIERTVELTAVVEGGSLGACE
jgi:hypothetical protein